MPADRRLSLASLVALGGLALGCAGLGGPSDAPPAPLPAEVSPVSHDLDALEAKLVLPDGARAATWRVERLGVHDPRVPGPTDQRLEAWVDIAPEQWATVDALYGPPRPPREDVRLTAEEVELLPPRLRERAEPDGSVLLSGPIYVPTGDEGRGWRVAVIVRVGDEGLWITAISS